MCYMLLVLTEEVCIEIDHFLSVSLANPIKFPTVLNMPPWPNKNRIHICHSSLHTMDEPYSYCFGKLIPPSIGL